MVCARGDLEQLPLEERGAASGRDPAAAAAPRPGGPRGRSPQPAAASPTYPSRMPALSSHPPPPALPTKARPDWGTTTVPHFLLSQRGWEGQSSSLPGHRPGEPPHLTGLTRFFLIGLGKVGELWGAWLKIGAFRHPPPSWHASTELAVRPPAACTCVLCTSRV